MVTGQFLPTDAQVWSQDSQCDNCSQQCHPGTGFPFSTSILPHKYHSTMLHTHVHLLTVHFMPRSCLCTAHIKTDLPSSCTHITTWEFKKNGTGELYENLFNFHFEWTTLMATLQENQPVFLCTQVLASLLYSHTFISLLCTCTAVTN